jgi:hypothetical protein
MDKKYPKILLFTRHEERKLSQLGKGNYRRSQLVNRMYKISHEAYQSSAFITSKLVNLLIKKTIYGYTMSIFGE